MSRGRSDWEGNKEIVADWHQISGFDPNSSLTCCCKHLALALRRNGAPFPPSLYSGRITVP
jgi:hypothetical protein